MTWRQVSGTVYIIYNPQIFLKIRENFTTLMITLYIFPNYDKWLSEMWTMMETNEYYMFKRGVDVKMTADEVEWKRKSWCTDSDAFLLVLILIVYYVTLSSKYFYVYSFKKQINVYKKLVTVRQATKKPGLHFRVLFYCTILNELTVNTSCYRTEIVFCIESTKMWM